MTFSNVHTSAPSPLLGCPCGFGGVAQKHKADGHLVAPDGDRIVPMCRADAEAVIAEYAEKLGEAWTFEPAPQEPPARTEATV